MKEMIKKIKVGSSSGLVKMDFVYNEELIIDKYNIKYKIEDFIYNKKTNKYVRRKYGWIYQTLDVVSENLYDLIIKDIECECNNIDEDLVCCYDVGYFNIKLYYEDGNYKEIIIDSMQKVKFKDLLIYINELIYVDKLRPKFLD